MSNILKNPYEISVWEDRLSIDKSTYEEVKIAIIGSDTMDTPIRAYSPFLTRNINGTNQFKFVLNAQYYSFEINEFVPNPFTALLQNETKIKLKYKDEWYDFTVKKIEENSKEKQIVYEAEDMFINELSKSGFSIELDSELYNNQGTIIELAEKVVEGTDWTIEESDIIRQKIEEPLYKLELTQSLDAFDMITQDSISIPAADHIYVFYSCLAEKTPYFQFLYPDANDLTITQDFILDSPNLATEAVEYKTESFNGIYIPTFAANPQLEDGFRGERLVRQQLSVFDEALDRVVLIYKDSHNNRIFGYTELEFPDPVLIENYITNGLNFVSAAGWTSTDNEAPVELKLLQNQVEVDYSQPYYMGLQTESKLILNSGIFDNRNKIKNITEGTEFIVGLRQAPTSTQNTFKGKIASYTIKENGTYQLKTTYAIFDEEIDLSLFPEGNNSYYYDTKKYFLGSFVQGIKHSDLITGTGSGEKIGFFLERTDSALAILEEVELFEAITSEEKYLVPGQVPKSNSYPVYYYYYPNDLAKDRNDLVFLHKNISPNPLYTPIYSENFEKIRSINISKSNRFNIIQTLCETFECWAKFSIEHSTEGHIVRDAAGVPKKTISFHNFIGQENYSGFRYGINLTGIQRNLISDQIVTKLIVEDNANEFGKDGFTTIARALENPIRENFILNFDYYIRHNLISYENLINDLYSPQGTYLNYYGNLRRENLAQESKINRQASLVNRIINLQAEYQTRDLILEEAKILRNEERQALYSYSGYTYEELIVANPNSSIKTILKDAAIKDFLVSIKALNNQVNALNTVVNLLRLELFNLEEEWEDIASELQAIRERKDTLNHRFFSKYSRYIQEGSWISEDYIDDNLYYLDAKNILFTSAFPQIDYRIDVLDLSQLEEYQNYTFELGDKTYVEDVEFFGYTIKNGLRTPYQEEVVVSEITYNLDDLADNRIIVQNYKTQFEDLFQRITAVTESLQHYTGMYHRAAGMVNMDGTIDPNLLQNSFNSNAFTLSNILDQSVVWDGDGITITDIANPSQIIRLVSGGLFLSNTGGEVWSAAITGDGINAKYIRTGQLDASRVNIMGGPFATFRWDEKGLNAYHFTRDTTTQQPKNFDFTKFVRFDQYGLYGYQGSDSFTPTSVDHVIQNTPFSLTWKGFHLKHAYDDGAVLSISPDRDILIETKDSNSNLIERVKLGKLKTINNMGVYGLRLKDVSGKTVLESSDSGNLNLTGQLDIGPTLYNPRVSLGALYTDTVENKTKVFNVKDSGQVDQLEIWDDGTLITNNIEIKGGKIGNLTIAEVEAGANSKYTWIRYADTITGEGLSENPEGKNYIGFAYNKTLASPSSNPSDYEWTLFKSDIEIPEELLQNYSLSSNIQTISIKPNVVYSYDSQGHPFQEIKVTALTPHIDLILQNNSTLEWIPTDLYAVEFKISTTSFILSKETLEKDYFGFEKIIEEVEENPFEENKYLKYRIFINKLIDPNILEIDISNLSLEEQAEYELALTELREFQSLILARPLSLEIRALDKETYTIISNTAVRLDYPTPSEAAAFLLTSSGLFSSIGYQKLHFTEEGLLVQNTGFRILNEENKPVLWADSEGNLNIRGMIDAIGGKFRGHIEATSGSFSGTINALSGAIGNIQIIDGGLSAANFTINRSGQVAARDLTLQGDINLDGRILLGDTTYIRQPTAEDNTVFRVLVPEEESSPSHYFQITADGDLDTDNIKLLGSTGEIKAGSIVLDGTASHLYDINREWSIKPEGAEFNHISIRSGVMDIAATQYVGGSMVYKESFRFSVEIEDGEEFILVEDDLDLDSLKDAYLVLMSSQNYNRKSKKVKVFYDEGTEKITFSESALGYDIATIAARIITEEDPLVYYVYQDDEFVEVEVNESNFDLFEQLYIKVNDIYQPYDRAHYLSHSETYINNLLIGINSSSANTNLLPGNALSFFFFDPKKETVEAGVTKERDFTTPLLLIGDLSGIPNRNLNGYGLYGENVFLTGRLTTQVGDGTYAGIHTLSNVKATKFREENILDSSKIVFWAGAQDESSDSIQDAPFQITEAGSLYAKHGIFMGSILVDSEIRGAKLFTSTIVGDNINEGGRLNIHSGTSSGGIFFYNNYKQDPQDLESILEIRGSGVLSNNKPIIDINSIEGTRGIFDTILTPTVKSRKGLNSTTIDYSGLTIGGSAEFQIPEKLKITSNRDGFGQILSHKTKAMTFLNSEIEVHQAFTITKDLTMQGKDSRLQYRAISDGYELYVY